MSVCANTDAKQFPNQQLTLLALGGVGGAGVQFVCVGGGGLMAVFLTMLGENKKTKLEYISKSLKCAWHRIMLSYS